MPVVVLREPSQALNLAPRIDAVRFPNRLVDGKLSGALLPNVTTSTTTEASDIVVPLQNCTEPLAQIILVVGILAIEKTLNVAIIRHVV